MPIQSVPKEIPAYSQYEWDDQSHRLESLKQSAGDNYGGFELALCRGDSVMGSRVRVVAGATGQDRFTPDNIRKLQELMGVHPMAGTIVLDREAREAGRICIQASDLHWLRMMTERVEKNCVSTLGASDPQNAERCETLYKTLKTAGRNESSWERFKETLPVGTGFFLPGAIGGAIFAGAGFVFKGLMSAPKVGIILALPDCDSPLWSEFTTLCPTQDPEI